MENPQNQMDLQKLYTVSGILNKNFVGQISYMISLEGVYDYLDIEFSFDEKKRTFSEDEITPELIREVSDACASLYDLHGTEEETRKAILSEMKTELHTLAELNGTFIGCVHKQLCDRHMTWKGEEASPGCIPQPVFEGVLKVTVLAFNVIKDHTEYTLTVSAGNYPSADLLPARQ